MSITEPSLVTASANPGSNVLEQAAPPPVVQGEPAEVADGVLVIPDGRVPLVPNVGFVVGDHAVLVIDTGVGRRNGAYVLEHAKQLAGGRPLFLTTTHFHPEHGFGAQVFKGEATIIYNRPQRDELHRKGAAYIEMFRGLGPDIAADDAAAAIEQGARARWDNWANPEWIGYAARAFYQASPSAARVEHQDGGSRRGD